MIWIDKVPSAPFTRRDIHGGDMDSVVDAVLDMAAGDPEFPRLPPARRLPTFGQLMPEFRVVSLRELMRSTGPLDSIYQATLLMMAAAADSTPTLGRFDFSSDNSKWHFRKH